MHRAAKQVVDMKLEDSQRRPRVSISTGPDLSYCNIQLLEPVKVIMTLRY